MPQMAPISWLILFILFFIIFIIFNIMNYFCFFNNQMKISNIESNKNKINYLNWKW